MDARPLVLHLVYRFDVGGLENGVVNLINHMPEDRYRHAVVSLTEVSDSFAKRLRRPHDVRLEALHKPAGHGVKLYPTMQRLFRSLKPSVVHSRNLAALEYAPVAWAANVPARVHGEHGRDASDPEGAVRRFQWVRRAYRPFVNRYVALSLDLSEYLQHRVGVAQRDIARIINGVDTSVFKPRASDVTVSSLRAKLGCPFDQPEHVVVGTVGRMQTVKNQPHLARAFVRALTVRPALRDRLRLAMVGDGPLMTEVRRELEQGQVQHLAWLAGERHDVASVMQALDAFVLPSSAEGISNTILEAMSCGLPVIATRVGGNAELVDHGVTGELMASQDVDAMARALLSLVDDADRARSMGQRGRQRVLDQFSMAAMVDAYLSVYDQVLNSKRH